MNVLQRALANGSVMLISQGVTWAASLVLTAALGRHLGASGFGNLYLAISFAVIFGLVVEFGLDQQVVRAVARDPSIAGSYLSAAAVVKIFSGALAYASMLVVVRALGYDAEFERTVSVYGLIIVSIGLSASLGSVYQGSQRMAQSAIATVIEKVSVAAAALLLFAHGFGIVEIAVAMVLGSALGGLWKARFIGRVVPTRWQIDGHAFRALLRGAPPFLLYAILGSVYYRVDTVLLSKLTDATVVGWYGAAYRLFDTMVFLPSIVSGAVMFPILAKMSIGSRESLKHAIGKGLEMMCIVGMPICVGLFVLAEPIIRLIYGGGAFLPAAEALRWLMPGLFFLYLNSILTVALLSLNREKRMTIVAGLACALNLGLNWMLIPAFQHVAAAAVTSATEVFIFGYLVMNIPRGLLAPKSLVVFLKSAVASVSMVAALLALGSAPTIALIACGAIVYLLAGGLLRLVTPEDVSTVRRAIKRRGRSIRTSESWAP